MLSGEDIPDDGGSGVDQSGEDLDQSGAGIQLVLGFLGSHDSPDTDHR